MAGDAVRGRQELVRVVAAEAERERAALAQHRFDEQRLRYAHELHDVVGHALVAINVRAAAAAHLARREQGASPVSALDEIASTSAEALGELRTALKGLRSDESDGAPLRPAEAGLADLGDLIAGVKGAGLTVELDMAAATEAVPPAIGHAGYRIVQEGLTNVLRHSTAKHARVRIGHDEGALLVEVLDNGQAVTGTGGGGHGLLGMHEHAGADGGSCEAGRAPGGGWRVRARIPDAGVATRAVPGHLRRGAQCGHLQRGHRIWAVPPGHGTYRGLDLERLDPDDEDERTFLLEAQHLDMEEALKRHEEMPGPDGEPINPTLHVALHGMIANQLLADEPPETWQTVQRLAGLGYDWHNVMHLTMGPRNSACADAQWVA